MSAASGQPDAKSAGTEPGSGGDDWVLLDKAGWAALEGGLMEPVYIDMDAEDGAEPMPEMDDMP